MASSQPIGPNKGVELTAYSVRSCLAPASSRSSRLALAFMMWGIATTDEKGAGEE
jgi:hypothetical protein